ncbi:MAG: DUF1289 domain-containing protein [Halomonas sp.]|nr:DUF1289 domain-containing protein [Halomonas sp.]MBR2515551.1 DUF1289 domain-containing protein [Halomonas sp.]
MSPASRPLSPCIQVCKIKSVASRYQGLSQELCQGCGRTLDEIACWGAMTEAEKAPVWERLEREGYAKTSR